MRLFAGRLNGSERGDLDGHLASCDRCALLVAEIADDSNRKGSPPEAQLRFRPPLLSPGMLVASRYHVRRLLGAGAMGEVHEVEDRLLGTIIALKTLNVRLAGDKGALARLKREVAAARSVTHPNVCRTFDIGSDPGSDALGAFVFLTMEYLPGVTLARYLAAHGPLAPAEALPLLIQLADGLAAAHAAGILHRDLKTDNVMLVQQRSGGLRGVIMDFGLAGFEMPDAAGVEQGSGFSGTVAYAAPERIAGGRATPASDVYSFGLIAHEMLTNRRPLPTVPWSPLRDGGALPASWARCLQRALQVDPKSRLATGGALAESLRELAGGARMRSMWGRKVTALAAAGSGVVAAIALAGNHRHLPEAPIPLRAAQEATSPARGAEPRTAAPSVVETPILSGLTELVRMDRPVVGRAKRPRTSPARPVSTPAPQPATNQTVKPPPPTNTSPSAPDEDLVRDVRFLPTKYDTDYRETGHSELVDPFAQRRAQPTKDIGH